MLFNLRFITVENVEHHESFKSKKVKKKTKVNDNRGNFKTATPNN